MHENWDVRVDVYVWPDKAGYYVYHGSLRVNGALIHSYKDASSTGIYRKLTGHIGWNPTLYVSK